VTHTLNIPTEYFADPEYRNKKQQMHPEIIIKQNQFRHNIGGGYAMSPGKGALVRYSPTSTSQHNAQLLEDGLSLAADGFPYNLDVDHHMQVARDLLIRGFGIYPDATFNGEPWLMYHIDCRTDPYATHGRMVEFARFRDPETNRMDVEVPFDEGLQIFKNRLATGFYPI